MKLQILSTIRGAFSKSKPALPGKVKSAGSNEIGWGVGYNGWRGASTTSVKESVWAFSGVQDISTSISSLPFQILNQKGEALYNGMPMSIEQKRWFALFQAPNPLFESVQLWDLTAMLFEIHGICFWIPRDASGNIMSTRFECPESITPVGPGTVHPRMSEDGARIIGWWVFENNGASKRAVEFWQVIRFYKTNPYSLVDGVRLSDIVGKSIELDKSAKETNSKFFDNGARRDGHLEYEGDMDADEIREWRDDYDSSYAGAGNHYKTPVLAHGFKYVHDSESIKDMDFPNLIKNSREEVIGAIRVPKHHLSLNDDVNHATADVGDRIFWQNNLLPKLALFESIVNSRLLMGTGLTCKFNTSNVFALKKDLKEKTEIAKSLYNLGYPINVINDMLGMGMPDVEEDWADQPRDPQTANAIGKNQEDTTSQKEAPSGNPFLEAAEKAAKSVADILTKSESDKPLSEMTPAELSELALSGDQNVIDFIVDDIEKTVVIPFVPGFEKAMKSYFARLEKSQMKRLNAFLAGKDYETLASDDPNDTTAGRTLTENDINRVLFTSEKWDDIIKETSLPFHKKAYAESLKRVEKEIGGFVQFTPGSVEVAKEVEKINKKIVGINHRLRGTLRGELASVIQAGGDNNALRSAVESVFDTSASRVNTIARTETGMAANTARWNVLSVETIVKRWLTAGDEIVRTSHRENGALGAVPIDFVYPNGLRFPQDQDSDSAGEVVNCRCVLIKGKKK